jgi:hypothetical protein
MNLLTPAAGEAGLHPGLLLRRGDSRADHRAALGGPTPPRRPHIAVSDYRVFSTVVFACIISLDVWSDLKWSSLVSAYVVGPSSVLVWALTLVGSFGIGPVYRAWNALYVRPRSRRLRAATLAKHKS